MGDIVCKFGGTSVADVSQLRKVESIIESEGRRRFIVPSAPGKRHSDDTKITDLLLLCFEMVKDGVNCAEPVSVIRSRYLEIAEELGVGLDAAGLLDEVEEQIRGGASRDFVASRGEYLCGRILADWLGARFVDAADGIAFAEDGALDPATYKTLSSLLDGEGLFVVPGFYGAMPDGSVKTFSRGGSDISGAIVARAVHAEVYENWTDVSGILMSDPRIVPGAKPIRDVTYRELRELAYMGASVMHDEAIFPVRELGIPVNIRNTNQPDDPGTIISDKRDFADRVVVGIAGRCGFSMLHIEKALMNREIGFGKRVLEIVADHGISYEHSPTGIDSMSVIIRDEELDAKAGRLLKDIQRILEPDRATLVKGLALLATVGHGMAHRVGVAATLFTALAEAGVNVRIIDQGSSEINIIVGVEDQDYEKAVKALYHAFVEQGS